MGSLRKPCLFCHSVGMQQSKEHVVPKWMQNHFKMHFFPIVLTQRHLGNPHDTFKDNFSLKNNQHRDRINHWVEDLTRYTNTVKRTHPLSALVNGNVCHKCNNGWMSNLENLCKPLLVGLINGTRHISSLNEEEKATLSRWALKTSYSLGFYIPSDSVIPAIHPYVFYKSQSPPSSVAVFAGHMQGNVPFNFTFNTKWNFALSDGANKEDYDCYRLPTKFYKLGISFHNLSLMVANLDVSNSVFWPISGVHYNLSGSTDKIQYENPNIGFALMHQNETSGLDKFCASLNGYGF